VPEPSLAYDVVFAVPAQEPTVLATASDADCATVAFHTHLAALRGRRERGALELRVRAGTACTLLREPLDPRPAPLLPFRTRAKS
jgi:hypothetical protein